MKDFLNKYVEIFEEIDFDIIEKVIYELKNFNKVHKIWIIGNGGSYSLAEHFSQDLLKLANIPAISLTNPSAITAYGNDISFDVIFSGQLNSLMRSDDILICFSSSGNSKDILLSAKMAKMMGYLVISFTGFDGGKLKEISDFDINIPSNNYGIIESTHSILFHYIAEEVSKKV